MMESCEVLVVGGGPAGSICAESLKSGGLDVLLLDSEQFPRKKPCAGWITPAVPAIAGIDLAEYRQGRVLQEISGFKAGLMNSSLKTISYGKTVSYGILRCEFDQYLLERSRVRTSLGEAVTAMEKMADGWIVNGRIKCRLLVGAGGNFCPVARMLGARSSTDEIVAGQVAEYSMTPAEESVCPIMADTPELYFCQDMKGYGWLFRKGRYLNVGLGRLDRSNLAGLTKEFIALLKGGGALPADFSEHLHGHAYRLYGRRTRQVCTGDGVLLIGDAAGVAYPQSGEGILPSIKSALAAAKTILGSKGDYRRETMSAYEADLAMQFGYLDARVISLPFFSDAARSLWSRLLSNSWFLRSVILDNWFLHNGRTGYRQ